MESILNVISCILRALLLPVFRLLPRFAAATSSSALRATSAAEPPWRSQHARHCASPRVLGAPVTSADALTGVWKVQK